MRDSVRLPRPRLLDGGRRFGVACLLAGAFLMAACDGKRGDGRGGDDSPDAVAPGAGAPGGGARRARDRGAELRRFWDVHDRARDLYASRDYPAARAAFREALELNPSHRATLYNLAHVEFVLRRHAEALDLLRTLASLDPHETKARLLAAAIRLDPSPWAPFDLAEARALLAEALEINREESGPYLLEGKAALLAGDLAVAAERLETALRWNPRFADALNLLGVIALWRGDLARASDLLSRAAEAARGAPPAAGLPGEGDTAEGGAGSHRFQLLLATWLRSVAIGPVPSGPVELRSIEALPATALPLGTATSAAPRSGRALAALDLDGDGVQDLAVGSLAGPIALFLSRDGRLEPAGAVELEGAHLLVPCDLDRDGRTDIYAVLGSDVAAGEARLLLNDGGGRLRVGSGPRGARRTLAAAAVDTAVDADGATEILEVGLASEGAGPVRRVRLLDGRWSVDDVAGVARAECALSIAVLPGAVPPDPRGVPGGSVLAGSGLVPGGRGQSSPRAVVALAHAPPVLIVRGAEGWSVSPGSTGLEAAGIVERIVATDLDGDGRAEIVVARAAPAAESLAWLCEGRASGSPLAAFREVAPGRFERSSIVFPDFSAGLTDLVAGDVDGDGRADLVLLCGGPEPWRLEPWWVLLAGPNGFALRRGPPLPRTPSAVAAAILGVRGPGPRLVVAGGGLLPWAVGDVSCWTPGGRTSGMEIGPPPEYLRRSVGPRESRSP